MVFAAYEWLSMIVIAHMARVCMRVVQSTTRVRTCDSACGLRFDHACGETLVYTFFSAMARESVLIRAVLCTRACRRC